MHIDQKVAFFHGDSDEVYGAPRILADLRADGEVVSRKTVAATMRRLGLAGICPKKWKTATIIDHADAYPVDAVKRKWDTGALNQVWVGDSTGGFNWPSQHLDRGGLRWDMARTRCSRCRQVRGGSGQRIGRSGPRCVHRARAIQGVADWIEDRYNRRRRHSSIGQVTPVDFEMQYSSQAAEIQLAA